MAAKTDAEKIEMYNRMIEGARKGGSAQKHFTKISKRLQVLGAAKGGHAGLGKHKNFKPESLKKFSENAKRNCLKRWHPEQVAGNNVDSDNSSGIVV